MKALLVISSLLFSVAFAKTEKWQIDQAHSKVVFEIPHLVISTVEGSFKSFKGDIHFDEKNLKAKDFSTQVEIDASSISTENEKRDQHLRSPDFFDVKKYPKLTFKSSSFSVKGKNIKIQGKLTLHGVTKEVILKGKYLGSVMAYDVKRIVLKAETEINRKDFGLKWNDFVEAGPAVGDEVAIRLRIEAKRVADL